LRRFPAAMVCQLIFINSEIIFDQLQICKSNSVLLHYVLTDEYRIRRQNSPDGWLNATTEGPPSADQAHEEQGGLIDVHHGADFSDAQRPGESFRGR
jgi:hypothetical protein